jgi:hypothetical protein
MRIITDYTRHAIRSKARCGQLPAVRSENLIRSRASAQAQRSSSSTTFRRTKFLAYARRSKRAGGTLRYLPQYSPDLNPTRCHSANSRPVCGGSLSAPSPVSTAGSARSLEALPPARPATISGTQAMRKIDRNLALDGKNRRFYLYD